MEKLGTIKVINKQIVEGVVDPIKFNTRGMTVKVPVDRVVGQAEQGTRFRLVFKNNQPWIHILEEQKE